MNMDMNKQVLHAHTFNLQINGYSLMWDKGMCCPAKGAAL